MTTTDSGMPHMHAELLAASDANIQRCAQALQNGHLVAFPTETVFGLGAAVSRLDAIQGIFKAKGRPTEHPLIAHVAPGANLVGWVAELTPTMQKLMNAFFGQRTHGSEPFQRHALRRVPRGVGLGGPRVRRERGCAPSGTGLLA